MILHEFYSFRTKPNGNKMLSYSNVVPFDTNSGVCFTVGTKANAKLKKDSSLRENSVEEDEEEEERNSLFKNLWGFLIVGKVIGLLPFSGVFWGQSSKEFTYRRASLTSIVSHLILVSIALDTALSVLAVVRADKRNTIEIVLNVRTCLFRIWGCFVFSGFLFRGNHFLEIFSAWEKTKLVFSKPDESLRRDTLLITGVIFTSAILENGFLHMLYLKPLDSFTGFQYGNRTDNMTLIEGFYHRANSYIERILGYNWLLALLAFLNNKWFVYAWNYLDVCIAVFGRAISFRFRTLHELAEERLLKLTLTSEKSREKARVGWLDVVQDFKKLCGLLAKMEAFLSSLVFGSYLVNIFYLALHLLEGFTSERSTFNLFRSVYTYWSFLHLLTRILTGTICAAQINVHAHKIQNIFQECPPEFYSVEIARTDMKVTAGPPIGFSGLGCFVVTKPLILSVLSVVFTLEIVFLQSMPDE